MYLHVKKRKRSGASGDRSNTSDKEDVEGIDNNAYKNDQVAFGQGFMRMGGGGGGSSIYGSKSNSSLTGRNSQNRNGSMRSLSASTPREEMGIIKSNPLLKHFPNLNDSDVEMANNSSNNELDEESVRGGSGKERGGGGRNSDSNDHDDDVDGRDSSGNLSGPEDDCIPQENVSIVDEMSAEDKLESMKAIVNGTIRRKLYFNPAYFEPELLAVSESLSLFYKNSC